MPVTARLSRKFYETFGDQIANGLVEWFNAVDLTYRSDLRDLNEANFARFDAKLEQRVAELDAKTERRLTELEAKMERRLTELNAKMDAGFARTDAKLEQRLAELRADLVKWMFLFWAGTALTVVGLLKF